MLLAVEGHQAMLFYLDNTISMGANSTAGINRSRASTKILRARSWSATRWVSGPLLPG